MAEQQQQQNGSSIQSGNGAPYSNASPADLVAQLDDYTPTIPDAVTRHFLSTSGFDTDDQRVVRLVSLCAQKFVAEIANDALQHCKMRGSQVTSNSNKKSKENNKKYSLTMDDLNLALADQGIKLKKPPYYM